MQSTSLARSLPAIVSKHDGLICFVILLFIYVITMPPDYSWAHFSADGGELAAATLTGGVPHPPGYPLYLWLSQITAQLPIYPIIRRFYLFSAICTALAATLLTKTLKLTFPNSTPKDAYLPLICGLSFGVTRIVWQNAVIAEVYGLALLVLAAAVFTSVRAKSSILIGCLSTLAVIAHPTNLLALPFLMASTQRQWPDRQEASRFVFGSIIGCAPVFILPFTINMQSPIIWGDLSTISGWWWLVSAQIYRPNLWSLTGQTALAKAGTWGWEILMQWAIVGWIVIISAFLRTPSKLKTHYKWHLTAAAFVIYIFIYNTIDSFVLAGPVFLFLTPALLVGLKSQPSFAWLLPLIFVSANILPVTQPIQENNVRPIVIDQLDQLPANAIVISPGDDKTVFTLWYFVYAEQLRTDLTIVDANLMAFDWYRTHLSKIYPELSSLVADDLSAFRQANSHRPICDISLWPTARTECPMENH